MRIGPLGAGAPELPDHLLELADRLVDPVGEQQRERHRQQRQGGGDEDHAGACRVGCKQLRCQLRIDLQAAALPGCLRLAADRVEQRQGHPQAPGIDRHQHQLLLQLPQLLTQTFGHRGAPGVEALANGGERCLQILEPLQHQAQQGRILERGVLARAPLQVEQVALQLLRRSGQGDGALAEPGVFHGLRHQRLHGEHDRGAQRRDHRQEAQQDQLQNRTGTPVHAAEYPAPGGQKKVEYSSPDHPGTACTTVLHAPGTDMHTARDRAAGSRVHAVLRRHRPHMTRTTEQAA